MHAVIVSVTINDEDAATTNLRNTIVPMVKQAPGFVAGYWVRFEGDGGSQGRGTMIFESEQAARDVADQVQQRPGEEVTLDSVDVGEVVEHA
jgi:hypothetical protein